MRELWDKFVKLLYKVGQDKWFHFIAGLIIAALPVIVFCWSWSPMVFSAAAGIGKEVFDIVTTKTYDWKDLVATLCGGLVIEVFVLLHGWLF